MTAGLTDSLFSVFAFGLVSSFGFFPDKVGHSKSAYSGHCSSSVIHVTAKADTVGLCTASFTNVSDSYVFILALWANHFQLSYPI